MSGLKRETGRGKENGGEAGQEEEWRREGESRKEERGERKRGGGKKKGRRGQKEEKQRGEAGGWRDRAGEMEEEAGRAACMGKLTRGIQGQSPAWEGSNASLCWMSEGPEETGAEEA